MVTYGGLVSCSWLSRLWTILTVFVAQVRDLHSRCLAVCVREILGRRLQTVRCPCLLHVSRGLYFPLEKTKGCMWGMSTLLSLLLLQWAQFLPFWNAKYGASFNFWGSLACYLRANQSSSSMRRAAGILIVQELPAALVDIKPNRPLDGRQQMLREWKDYCLKTQWHPSPSLSLLLSHSLMATACTQTQHSIAETQSCVLAPSLCYIVSSWQCAVAEIKRKVSHPSPVLPLRRRELQLDGCM